MSPSRVERLLAASLGAALTLAPRVAQACSVCTAGRDDETRAAFLATTGVLSLLPLVMVGGLVWWLRRRARELDAAESERAAAGVLSRTSSSQ